MAESLGLVTVAEGLEFADQVEQAREAHCELGQGFFFARPVDARSVRDLIAGDSSRFDAA